MTRGYLLQPYGEKTVILKHLKPRGDQNYKVLVCDYPIDENTGWKFWIEAEDINSEVTTEEAILTEKEIKDIKELIRENSLFSNLKE